MNRVRISHMVSLTNTLALAETNSGILEKDPRSAMRHRESADVLFVLLLDSQGIVGDLLCAVENRQRG